MLSGIVVPAAEWIPSAAGCCSNDDRSECSLLTTAVVSNGCFSSGSSPLVESQLIDDGKNATIVSKTIITHAATTTVRGRDRGEQLANAVEWCSCGVACGGTITTVGEPLATLPPKAKCRRAASDDEPAAGGGTEDDA